MTSRIHRGFHRIGVVLAVPVLLMAGALAGHEVWLRREDELEIAALTGRALSALLTDPETFPHRADYTGAIVGLVLAMALYAAAHAVGWVFAGFISPGHRA